MSWSWEAVRDDLPDLLVGLATTVEVTLLAAVLALSLGLVFALGRRSNVRLVRCGSVALIEGIRRTPLLIQLYLIFYALPTLGLTLPALAAGIVGLGAHYAAAMSEIYRAAMLSIPAGQWDAATALRLPPLHKWARVILPQAVPAALPAMANCVIAMVKDSAVLSAITVTEILAVAREQGAATYDYLVPLTLAGLLYAIVSSVASIAVRSLERRLVHA